MIVVVAPNALKESANARAAARAIARGVRRADPAGHVREIPVADGGDGLVDVLREALGAETRTALVAGPRFDPVEAAFLHDAARQTAVVEMAAASGLALLSKDRQNPLLTTTRGTGELIRHALDLGAEHVIVGIGGSATTDGGVGMASALGVRFLDADGKDISPVGGELERLARIDVSGLDPRLTRVRVEAVCDVDNPLLGPNGAARIFGPQKGASTEAVERLEAGLARLAERISADLGVEVRTLVGGGAAGGLGVGLAAFLGAELRPGVEVVLDLVELDAALRGADLAFTAEGRLDAQTAAGKGPAGVARRAAKAGVPCVALAGSVAPGWENLGLTAAFSIAPGPVSLAEAMANAETLLAAAAESATRTFLAGRDSAKR